MWTVGLWSEFVLGSIFESKLGWYPKIGNFVIFLNFWNLVVANFNYNGIYNQIGSKRCADFLTRSIFGLYTIPQLNRKNKVEKCRKLVSKPSLLGSKIAFLEGGGQKCPPSGVLSCRERSRRRDAVAFSGPLASNAQSLFHMYVTVYLHASPRQWCPVRLCVQPPFHTPTINSSSASRR